MKSIFMRLVAVTLLLLFVVSCSKQTELENNVYVSSAGNTHNALLSYVSESHPELSIENLSNRKNILDENGYMSYDVFIQIQQAMKEFMVNQNYDAVLIDGIWIEFNSLLNDMGSFSFIDGKKCVAPFDSTFVIRSYLYMKNSGHLTSLERSKYDPLVLDTYSYMSKEQVDEAIQAIENELPTMDIENLQKMSDFVSVYLASQEYWELLYRDRWTSLADGIGNRIGNVVGGVVGGSYGGLWGGGIGAVIGGDLIGALYSWQYSIFSRIM